MYHVRCAIDAGTSRHTAAVFFQVRHHNGSAPPRVTVFGDYHALDVVSRRMRSPSRSWPIDSLSRQDRPGAARPGGVGAIVTGARGLFRVRAGVWLAAWSPGGRATWFWTGSRPSDLLLESGNLLIHPRCTRLKDAFQNILPSAPGWRVGRLPGRRPPRRRLDRCAPRRHPRCLPRRPAPGPRCNRSVLRVFCDERATTMKRHLIERWRGTRHRKSVNASCSRFKLPGNPRPWELCSQG